MDAFFVRIASGGPISWRGRCSCSRCTELRMCLSTCQCAAGGGCCHHAEVPPCHSGPGHPNARPRRSPLCAAARQRWSHATASSPAWAERVLFLLVFFWHQKFVTFCFVSLITMRRRWECLCRQTNRLERRPLFCHCWKWLPSCRTEPHPDEDQITRGVVGGVSPRLLIECG